MSISQAEMFKICNNLSEPKVRENLNSNVWNTSKQKHAQEWLRLEEEERERKSKEAENSIARDMVSAAERQATAAEAAASAASDAATSAKEQARIARTAKNVAIITISGVRLNFLKYRITI